MRRLIFSRREMVFVQHAARLDDVDRRSHHVSLPREFGQPLQIGADHAGFRDLLRAYAPAGGVPVWPGVATSCGIPALSRALLQISSSSGGLASSDSPSSFWICLQLLAQHELALTPLHGLARAVADVRRQPQHLQPVRQAPQHGVEPLPQIHGLQDRLLLAGGQVEQAGHQIGQHAGQFQILHRGDQLRRRLLDQPQRLERALPQLVHARGDLGAIRRGFGDALDGHRRVRQALGSGQQPDAADALHDGMMRAVPGGDVAQAAAPPCRRG